MGKGLGKVIGTVAGSYFGPAGAAVGGAVGGMIDGQGTGSEKMGMQNMNRSLSYLQGNVNIADSLDKYLMTQGDKGVEYAQGMMNDWENAFGSVEKNLSDYYNNLDPTKFSQEAKTMYAEQLDKNMKQYNETMTQRGLQTSGSRAQAEKEAMFNKATTNAAIDINAPEQVAQMKQSWYNQGAGQKNVANQANINALTQQGNYATIGANAKSVANTNLATGYMGKSNFYNNQASNQSSGLGAIGGLLGSSMGSSEAGNRSALGGVMDYGISKLGGLFG